MSPRASVAGPVAGGRRSIPGPTSRVGAKAPSAILTHRHALLMRRHVRLMNDHLA